MAQPARWRRALRRLPSLLANLTSAHAAPRLKHRPRLPMASGVYLLRDASGTPRYVGQSRRLRDRLGMHMRPSSGPEAASLAFRIAERLADERGLRVRGTRKERAANARFKRLFDAAKRNLATWDVQVVEVQDEVDRTLLEVYAALSLRTTEEHGGYNSFETH